MKKFLFTLAALLMAGSAFASCLFTMDPFEIPADKIGKNVQIPIRAEFGEYVSAWQCDVDVPEGLAFMGVKKGETYPIMGIDEFGDEFECSPDINRNGTRFIVAVMAGNYSEDGELYGVCKWAPGTYENFLYFVVKADETYAGGQMQIHTQFSCGMDKRPEINDNRVDNTVVYSNDPVEVTVEQTEPTTAPAPTFSYDAETFTMTATCEDHEVELYANGEKVDNPYTVEQTDEDQEITFSAITLKNDEDNDSPETFYEENPVIVPALVVVTPGAPTCWTSMDDDNLYLHFELAEDAEEGTELVIYDENGDEVAGPVVAVPRPEYDPDAEDVHAIYTAYAVLNDVQSAPLNVDEIVPQKAQVLEPTATPTVEIVETEEGFEITATGDGVITLYVNDEVVAEGESPVTYTVLKADYPEGEEIPVTATALEDGKTISEWAPAQVIEVLATLKGAINFGTVDQETGRFDVSYNGQEDVTITLDNEEIELVRDANNTYQLPAYGTYTVTATAEAEGFYAKSKTETLVWNAPAEPVQTAAPEVVTTPGDDAYTIEGKVKEGDPEAEVTIYVVTVDETTGEEVRTEVTNPYVVSRGAEDQTINIVVVAHIDGQTDGETTMSVLIPKKVEDPTAVSELMSGKTVAAVRYFNLAGQEMQEANGVTIVVTTYTDGTTSAVKVMK